MIYAAEGKEVQFGWTGSKKAAHFPADFKSLHG